MPMDLLAELTRTNVDPAVIARVSALLERQQALLAEKDFKIKALTLELAYYRRISYGKKSEALNGEQRDLFEETIAADLAAIHAELAAQEGLAGAETNKRQRSRAGRQPLPPESPRIEHRHEPESCQYGACGQALVLIFDAVSEQLDVEPARFFVHRHIRPQYACRACEQVTAAPIPAAIIDGGKAAPGLLAWVAVSKYVDHLPLYRIEQIGARQNVPLARSTLGAWVGQTGAARPVLDQLHAWLHTTSLTVAAGSGNGKAIEHALKRWPAVMRYADAGTLPIDNNPVRTPSARSPSARKTGCLQAPNVLAAAPPPSRVCSAPPN
jgi:transposase